jgi:hypothetical protein
MVVIPPVTVWIDLLLGFAPWILLLLEGYLAKRVYAAARHRKLLHQKTALLRLLAGSLRQSPPGTHASDSAGQEVSHNPLETLPLLLLLHEQLPVIPNVTWERLARATVVASVFALTYLGMGILLRPFVSRAALNVLPLCLPLTIIPLSYLLRMKPRPTLLVLVAALGLSFLTLVLMRV